MSYYRQKEKLRFHNNSLTLLGLICIVLSVQQACGYHQDKSALYDKYPQLLSNDTDPCIRGLNQVLINLGTQAPQEVMTLSTMHGLNDLGSLEGCQHGTLADLATYSTLKINVTHIPVSLISGVCLPIECTQHNLTGFGDTATDKVNSLLIKAQKKYDLFDLTKGFGLVKDYSRLTMTLQQSDAGTQEWQDRLRVGYICALVFIGVMMAAFCIAPNAYLLVNHFSKNRRDNVDQADEFPDLQSCSELKTEDVEPISAQKLEQKARELKQNQQSPLSIRSTDVHLLALSEAKGKSSVLTQSLAASLYENRVTYKYYQPQHDQHQKTASNCPRENDLAKSTLTQRQNAKTFKDRFLSFSIVNAWESLSHSKCKQWDDTELDVFEGVKFFSFFLGQLCLTAQFLMCTQTINPWMIQRFFQELIFTIVVSSNIVMEAFTTLSAFLGAYKLFSLIEAQGHLKVTDVLKFWARKYLRLAPMYYFIFFCGWAIFPYLGAGPIWYSANQMYDECNDYWWAQLLMIGNIYPYFQAPNYGCFFWGWPITTDLQLALITPIFVLIYSKREWMGNLFVFVVVAVDTYFIVQTCLDYGLRVGPFAEENWYLFSYLFQKPFFKVNTFAPGITAAYWYMKILSFRRIPDEQTRQAKHPFINYLHHSNLTHAIMSMVGFGLVLTALLISHTAVAAPYSWTMTENALYFGLGRLAYVIGIWLILFTFFTGGFTFGKAFMSRPLFRVLGKLAFESALITPLAVQLIYSQLPNGLFVQFNKVLELGLGNVVCVMVASIFLYLLFEYPFKRLIDISLLPYLTHDDVLELVYVRRQIGAPLNHEDIKPKAYSPSMQVPNSLTSTGESVQYGMQGKPINITNVESEVLTHNSQGKKVRESDDSFNNRNSYQ